MAISVGGGSHYDTGTGCRKVEKCYIGYGVEATNFYLVLKLLSSCLFLTVKSVLVAYFSEKLQF